MTRTRGSSYRERGLGRKRQGRPSLIQQPLRDDDNKQHRNPLVLAKGNRTSMQLKVANDGKEEDILSGPQPPTGRRSKTITSDKRDVGSFGSAPPMILIDAVSRSLLKLDWTLSNAVESPVKMLSLLTFPRFEIHCKFTFQCEGYHMCETCRASKEDIALGIRSIDLTQPLTNIPIFTSKTSQNSPITIQAVPASAYPPFNASTSVLI